MASDAAGQFVEAQLKAQARALGLDDREGNAHDTVNEDVLKNTQEEIKVRAVQAVRVVESAQVQRSKPLHEEPGFKRWWFQLGACATTSRR